MGVYAGRFILDFTGEVLNASEHMEIMCVFDAGGLMTNDEFLSMLITLKHGVSGGFGWQNAISCSLAGSDNQLRQRNSLQENHRLGHCHL